MQSIILHLDMNSYFASVEQQDNPVWRGLPLGVCEHLGGIIIAASIEAKKLGIKTGTPVWEAKKIYPKIILTHTRPEAYRKYNRKFVKVVSDYTDKVEVYSIDEVFVDITESCNIKVPWGYRRAPSGVAPEGALLIEADPFEEAVQIAKEIKQRIKQEVGDYLTCSIGIAENKLLSKIGSDLKKPDGIVVVMNNESRIMNYECPTPSPSPSVGRDGLPAGRQGEVVILKHELYQILKLTDVPGIGDRMEKNLNALGIKTLLDLKNYPKSKLVALFGVMGHHLYNMGHLKSAWKPDFDDNDSIKSIGHMYTLPKEYRKPEFFEPVLYKLCEMAARRLRKKQLEGNIIYLHTHDVANRHFAKSHKLGFYIDDGRDIFLQTMAIHLENNIKNIGYRLIGVSISGLRAKNGQQSLFHSKKEDSRYSRLMSFLDQINDKYGPFTIIRAKMLKASKVFRDSVGFGRIKEL